MRWSGGDGSRVEIIRLGGIYRCIKGIFRSQALVMHILWFSVWGGSGCFCFHFRCGLSFVDFVARLANKKLVTVNAIWSCRSFRCCQTFDLSIS